MNNLTEQMEQDQTEVIKSTTNIKTLSDQVLKLRAMEDQLKIMEEALKTKKKETKWMRSEEMKRVNSLTREILGVALRVNQ